MTTAEFKKQSFANGDRVIYKEKVYPIAQIDFEEQLFGIIGEISNSPEEITWKRCDNCEFIGWLKID